MEKIKNVEENNISKKSITELKKKFIDGLIKKNLSLLTKNKFIDEIMYKESFDDSSFLKARIDEFKAYSDDIDINTFDIKNINIFDLRRSIFKEFLKLDNVRKNYLTKTLLDFNLSDEQKNILKKEIKFLPIDDLERFISNDKDNTNYINALFWDEILKKDFNFLDLKSESLKQRYKKLSQEERKILKEVNLYAKTWRLTSDLIQDLFKISFLKKKEKEKIIEKFIPYISLQEAIDFWLLNIEQANKKREELVKTILIDRWIEEDKIKDIIWKIDLKDIKISTDNFFNTEENLDKIALKKWFDNIEKQLKDIIKNNNLESNDDINLLNDFWLDKEDLKTNNILSIKISEKNDSDFYDIFYYKVHKISDNDIEIQFIWKNKDIHYWWNKNKLSLKNFNSFLKEKNIKDISTINEKKFKEKILDKDSWFDVTLEFWFIEEIDDTNRENLTKTFIKNLKSKKQNLEKELSLLSQWIWEYSSLSSEDKNKKQFILEEELKNIIEQISRAENNNLTDNELKSEANFLKFLEELDYIDKDGKKLWFKKGIFIEKWEKKDFWVYEVLDIDKENWNITLNSIAGKEIVPYNIFLKVFKKEKAKRVKKINNIDEILNSRNSENKWKNIIFKDWLLIDKEAEYQNKKQEEEIDYLVSDDNDKIIKINSINWTNVTIQFWERENLDDNTKKKEWYKKNSEVTKLKLQEAQTISLNELNKFIDEFKLYPDWKTWRKDLKITSELENQNNLKWKFSTRLFNRYSISELVAGWKMMVDWILESLKKWNDIHSARFALTLWTILPEEVRADLEIKVEREEAEAMDKAIDGLSKVDSPIATWRIKDWLLNKDTPDYKKEAGLMFMLQKYWVLYAKKLTPFQWKFLWYEAFWGKIWDKLYTEIKEECERNNVPFSEEKLMHMLLKKQCKWDLKPKRRSRLHKDYEWKWKNWVKEEFEKWYADADKKRNATEMIKGWMWEAFWGTTPNAIWWFKKAVERWDTPEIMSEWFFTLLYSWVLWATDENLLVTIKNLWDWAWLPIIMIRFASNKWDIDFFNKFILELSKRIGEVYKDKYPKIWERAQDIFDIVSSWKWTEEDRLKKTQEFWHDYWTVLSRSLNFQDLWESDTSKTDKIVLLEKDKNPIFNSYYEKVRAFTWIWWAFNKDLMDDESWEHWLAWLNHQEIIKRFFRMDSWRSIPSQNISIVERLWRKISEDINSIPMKNMEINWWDDKDNKKNYLILMFRDIFSWFISNHPDITFIKKYIEASPFKDNMKRWWVDEDIMKELLNFSSSWIERGDADGVISKIVTNILDWGIKNWQEEKDPIFDTTKLVKDEIDLTIKED